ncbi:unnamed protein product [Brassica oleracea]
MEQKKTYKKRKTQLKSSTSFPVDLTTEILLRLPEKSVAKFSCVSKLWSSIITDPYFINLFQTQSLQICFQKDDNLFFSSIPQNSNRSYFSTSLSFDQTKLPENCSHWSSTESVHGLICFHKSDKLIAWNPSTRQFLVLPNLLPSSNDTILFLGYDPIERKHKVMCIPRNRTFHKCQVLTLGSDLISWLWRRVGTNQAHSTSVFTYGRCVEGVIYYLAYSSRRSHMVMMSFDVRSAKFHMIELPCNFTGRRLVTYKGRLACCNRNIERGFWILEDAQRHKWSSQHFLSPFGTGCRDLMSVGNGLNLKGFTHGGEFIYAPDRFSQSFYILLCDPVRNTCRRFEFKGLADNGSVNSGVGDVDRSMYALHTFPNHIDSLKAFATLCNQAKRTGSGQIVNPSILD